MSLRTRLVLFFLLIAVVPVALVGLLAFDSGRRSLRQSTYDRLLAINDLKQAELARWLEGNRQSLEALAARPPVQAYTRDLATLPDGDLRREEAQRRLRADHLGQLAAAGGFRELFIIRPEDGMIVAATDRTLEGAFREDASYFVESQRHAGAEAPGRAAEEEQVLMPVATTIAGTEGEVAGVLVGHLDVAEMAAIMAQAGGETATQQTYMLNQRELLTESGLVEGTPAQPVAAGEWVVPCVAGAAGTGTYTSYRGIQVFGAYRWLPQQEMCLVTEVERAVALAPVLTFGARVLLLGSLIALFAGGVGILLADSVARPLQQLVAAARELSAGNLAHRVDAGRKDELGTLASGLNQVAANLDIAQREIRESEERYRILVETSPVPIVVYQQGQIVFANGAAVNALAGQAPAEFIGRPLTAFLHADSRVPAARQLQTVYEEGRQVALAEARLLRLDGKVLEAEVVGVPIHFGEEPAALVVFYDVTARNRAQQMLRHLNEELAARVAAQTEALRQREAELQAIFEAMPDLVLVLNAAGKYLKVVASDPKLLAEPEESLVGRTLGDVFPEERAAFFLAQIRQALRTGETTQVEYSLPVAGNTRWFQASIASMGDDTVVWVARDITDRRRAEQELRRSNEELQRFAYVASHDLQEPLRMVTNYLQLLQRRYQGQLDADAHEFIEYAVDGATRMKSLINDLLAYSRVGTRGDPFVPTDLNAELERVLRDLALAIEDAGATITHEPLPVVLADPGQMRQLLQNLLGNALKFRGEAPPQIQVGVEQVGQEWLIRVTDNGIGLDTRFGERIFNIFQRLHPVGTYPGTGIGLAICKKIVTRHGGRIWVESAPGEGAVFCFTLPRAEDTGTGG